MRPNPLACALAAGIALIGGAHPLQAINLNPRGTGQVLLFPYYTVNAGNQTLITLVNPTGAGKALKLRFREGRNARTVLDVQIYLAPYDIWTASVFSLANDGPANLYTTDNSCTVPRIKRSTQLPSLLNGARYAPFSSAAYTGVDDDAGPDTPERSREGYFEVLELGEVTNRTQESLTAITAGSNGIPSNCRQIENAWLQSASLPERYWITDPLVDIDPPGGGLYGNAAIIDALGGTMMSYDADAIDGFSDIAQHTAPMSPTPSLATARSSADSAVARVFADGEFVESSYPLSQAIDAVSAVLMQRELFNAFVTSPTVGGASEWVVTFPTKFAYTDQAIVGATATQPFLEIFPTRATAGQGGIAPVYFGIKLFDRETGPNAVFCEDPFNTNCVWAQPYPPQFFWASSVLSFNQDDAATAGSTLLGSSNVVDLPTRDRGVSDGWLHLGFHRADLAPLQHQRLRPDRAGGRWEGLPVSALLFESYTNGRLTPGVLSNYAGASRHRGFNRYVPAQ
jgi:hypothetical protein